jgi:hypothetical protein
MKVTINTEGEVAFDTDDVGQALDMIKALRNGHAVKPKKSHKRKPEPAEEVPLSAPLLETWNWMVAEGATEGVSAGEVADALGLKQATAGYRLGQLVEKGLAHSPKRGVYCPGEASE